MPKPAPGQPPMFKGTFDCLMKTVSKEVSIQESGLFGYLIDHI